MTFCCARVDWAVICSGVNAERVCFICLRMDALVDEVAIVRLVVCPICWTMRECIPTVFVLLSKCTAEVNR